MAPKFAAIFVLVALFSSQVSDAKISDALTTILGETRLSMNAINSNAQKAVADARSRVKNATAAAEEEILNATKYVQNISATFNECRVAANDKLAAIRNETKNNLENCDSAITKSIQPALDALKNDTAQLNYIMQDGVRQCEACGFNIVCHAILPTKIGANIADLFKKITKDVEYLRTTAGNGTQCVQDKSAEIQAVSQEAKACVSSHQ